MKNFAAQQLSKKEMNNVKGGVECSVHLKGGGSFPASGPSIEDVVEALRPLKDSIAEIVC